MKSWHLQKNIDATGNHYAEQNKQTGKEKYSAFSRV